MEGEWKGEGLENGRVRLRVGKGKREWDLRNALGIYLQIICAWEHICKSAMGTSAENFDELC